jgi:hypothetical protein
MWLTEHMKNGMLSYNYNSVKYFMELMFTSLVVQSIVKAVFNISLGNGGFGH